MCDLGLSKSATVADDSEIYGIIPYVAPEVLQGQKYTEKSDIYSFGMIMWEYMTGRRPFWDRAHDTELIIDICDGLRPPISNINAPEGYIELMKECWDPDQSKRPTSKIFGPASGISKRINRIRKLETEQLLAKKDKSDPNWVDRPKIICDIQDIIFVNSKVIKSFV
ncbi:10664_t:CDS:2 [Funneliformis geosporum]|uniref:10664_t:CDS:1 n=1 Tax=Funneliformis geosporum TaxID=1117311 RepID=A0A9W4SQ02_9GLOM|nr:10664_t:CDS:2 [Funneliformis geosporum]